MTLSPGTRLGPYEIAAQIGVGGMGEVYRATDTNLKRQVALKVLLPSVTGDADRLARFQREAEVLAALNHPNIAAIYGLERGADQTALVMELVEGPTLADRIARGPLPIDEALPTATQIADALEAAHELGIVHRDLKPANIKVRPDGTVKVLDFGLAKALEPAVGVGADVTASPTITSPAITRMGVILGTPAYMSPEQAKGRAADKRSDVWALGCVLYEMLTGTRAFGGEDVTETLAFVISREPDWTALPAPTPTSIRRLLRRCLEKDRKRRLADMGDARFEIEDALTRPEPEALSVTQAPTVSPGAPLWRRSLPWGVASLLLVGLGLLSVLHFRETTPNRSPEIRAEIVTPPTRDPISFALSPDGRQIVFVASGDGPSRLWVRSLAETAARPLPGTEGATDPFWSPDSGSVGFSAGAQLNRVDVGGGAPRALTKRLLPGRGGTWNADGVILFAPNILSPLFRVSASGGEPVAVTKLDPSQASHGFPSFLPDDRHFLFHVEGTPDTSGIYLGRLDTGETTRLTVADTAGAYLPAGWLLWVSAGKLVAQRLDVERRALVGSPVTVADPVGSLRNKGAFSVSATGLVAYRSVGTGRQQLRWVDRTGTLLGPLGTPDETNLATPRVSPNGQHVAVSRRVQGNTNLWLLNGTGMSRFTFDPALDRYPLWSSDGSRIVFSSNTRDAWSFYVGVASTPGIGTPLLEVPLAVDSVATDWSADDRFVMYMSRESETNWDLWVLPLAGDRTPQLFLKTTSGERSGQFSPDGRWVAYTSDESGRSEIYARPFAAAAAPTAPGRAPGVRAAEQWQVSTAGGTYSRWKRDGTELYYLGPDGRMMAVSIRSTGATLQPGTPVALFDAQIRGGGADLQLGMQYDVTRDGRFLINSVLDDAAAPITLLQNWAPGLSQ